MNHNMPNVISSTENVLMPVFPEIHITPTGAEFDIGQIHYKYQGPTERGQLFSSVGPDSIERPIMVYESQSQGAARASQGYEPMTRPDGTVGRRLLKGRELSPDAQYTQDTQLHPMFDAAVGRIEEDKKLKSLAPQQAREYEKSAADWLAKDFEAQTEVRPLASREVDLMLGQLKAGHLSKENVCALTSFDPDTQTSQANYGLSQKIYALNALLERSGVIPDFDAEPSATDVVNYPQIGNVVRDTYIKTVDGVRYEWQMAHIHNSKAAWIERIRFADAEPSVYGTDKQLVNSGILTSKPLEYTEQCNGLPEHMRQDLGRGYSDITPFLATLAPIAKYANTYQNREQFYHFTTKAA